MKIAVLSSIHWRTPPEKYGPLELISSYVAEGMVKKGHEVTLYATGDSKTSGKLRSVCPKPLMEQKVADSRVYEYLHSALVFEEASEFDIIHNHNDVFPLVFSRLVKTPVITTIHGYYPGIEEIYNKYKDSNYVSISFAARKQLPNINYIGNVYHGIPIEEFSFNNNPEDYFCYLGRITASKGIDLAVKLAKKMNLKLFLAGIVDKADQSFFENFVKPELSNTIQYLGNLGKEKRELLRKAKGLIHLNNAPEAFGLTFVEAMACGTPVITMNIGSAPEIIENKKTGFLLNNLEEAETAVEKIDQIARKDCREKVERNFTLERMIDEYENIYKIILEKDGAKKSLLV